MNRNDTHPVSVAWGELSKQLPHGMQYLLQLLRDEDYENADV